MIISIRTDKPEAEIGLFQPDGTKVDYKTWEAHRQLSTTILRKINEMLEQNSLSLEQLKGIVFFEGPGSFTGLRIGASLTNALSLGLQAHVVNASGENWIQDGIRLLAEGQNQSATPQYGSAPHITVQKK